MKIGISSYSYESYRSKTGADCFDIAKIAKQQGFDGVEFLPFDKRPEDANLLDTAKALRAHCEALGIEICASTVKGDFLNGIGVPPAEEARRVKGCVDICRALGARVMRHDIAWRLPEGVRSWREAIPRVAPEIREVAAYAQGLGIRTCTENHGYLFQDAERVESLICAVDHPNFGWLVDIGNFACVDERSDRAVGIAAPYAFHVHAKDFLIKSGDATDPGQGWFRSRGGNYLRGTVVGHGQIPIRPCVDILKRAGYDGFISLEFEGMEDNLEATQAGLSFLRRIVAGE